MRKGFTAAASHEFKTPLTLLRGYLEMLQENRLPEGAQQKACQVMVEEIDSLDHLVLELLDLTVTQENKREGEAGPFFLELSFFSAGMSSLRCWPEPVSIWNWRGRKAGPSVAAAPASIMCW